MPPPIVLEYGREPSSRVKTVAIATIKISAMFLLGAAVGAIGAFIVIPPTFRASGYMQVKIAPTQDALDNAFDKALAIANAESTRTAAAKGPDWNHPSVPPDFTAKNEILDRVKIERIPQSQLIAFSVKAADPSVAEAAVDSLIRATINAARPPGIDESSNAMLKWAMQSKDNSSSSNERRNACLLSALLVGSIAAGVFAWRRKANTSPSPT